jgi:hypothetical protein
VSCQPPIFVLIFFSFICIWSSCLICDWQNSCFQSQVCFFWFVIVFIFLSGALASSLLCDVCVLGMDFTGSQQDVGSDNTNVATNAPPPTPANEVHPNIPHAPYFQGYTGMGNHVLCISPFFHASKRSGRLRPSPPWSFLQ